jgi:ABC-type multidrug transport system fused ATPase/permease subunit
VAGQRAASWRSSALGRVKRHDACVGGGPSRVDPVSRCFVGIHALQDVDFSVAPGSITALIGPKGAGKRSLVRAIS